MSTVYTAARDGEIAALQTALRQGGEDAADRFQCSALYMAARGGHTRAVELLLKSQADPNLANNGGWTPLIVAAARNHHAVIEQLLRAGADASAQTCAYVTATSRTICSHRLACRCDGKTALHKTRSRECTLLLKTAMARPRTVSPTPLSGKTSPSCGHGCEPDDAADEPVNLFDQLVAHVTKLLDGKSAPSQPMHAGRRVAQAQKMSPTSVISGPSGSEENAISGWKLDGGPGLPISEPVRQAAVESAPGEECQAEVAWEAEDTSWRRQRDACAGPCRNTA